MEEKTDIDIFIDYVPIYSTWYKVILVFIYHFIIFITIIITIWWITSKYWITAIPIAFLLTTISNLPFIYMFKNSEKIREKYPKKYQKNPWQHFWFHYSYTSPFGCAALYYPLMLKTNYFLPSIILLPDSPITNTFLPTYVALLLGCIFIIKALLFIKPSDNFDGDMGNYLHIIAPDKKRILRGGIYQYIRHPRFLSRLLLSLGLGILANNILAVIVAVAHFIPYYVFMIILDKELIRIFGDDVKKYQENVPAFIPKYGNWKKFIKTIYPKFFS